jgi:hypothetical protein
MFKRRGSSPGGSSSRRLICPSAPPGCGPTSTSASWPSTARPSPIRRSGQSAPGGGLGRRKPATQVHRHRGHGQPQLQLTLRVDARAGSAWASARSFPRPQDLGRGRRRHPVGRTPGPAACRRSDPPAPRPAAAPRPSRAALHRFDGRHRLRRSMASRRVMEKIWENARRAAVMVGDLVTSRATGAVPEPADRRAAAVNKPPYVLPAARGYPAR